MVESLPMSFANFTCSLLLGAFAALNPALASASERVFAFVLTLWAVQTVRLVRILLK